MPAGLQGHISGLTDGQTATITLYALPPLPGEQYGQGEPPSPDGSWTYPPEESRLAAPPGIVPDWPLVATLRVDNGRWGLVDPSLVGRKYLVVASAPDQIVDPPAYEVVIFAGKALGFPGGVDFAYGPSPVARPIPCASAAEVAKLVGSNTGRGALGVPADEQETPRKTSHRLTSASASRQSVPARPWIAWQS